MKPNRTLSRFWAALWFYRDIQSNVATEDNPHFTFPDRLPSVFSALGEKANSYHSFASLLNCYVAARWRN